MPDADCRYADDMACHDSDNCKRQVGIQVRRPAPEIRDENFLAMFGDDISDRTDAGKQPEPIIQQDENEKTEYEREKFQ